MSTQTINEFVNVTTRKKVLSKAQAAKIVDELFSLFLIEVIDHKVIQRALALSEELHYSYFDSLMIASALEAECSILYSEDMHHDHTIEKKLKIVNPLRLK